MLIWKVSLFSHISSEVPTVLWAQRRKYWECGSVILIISLPLMETNPGTAHGLCSCITSTAPAVLCLPESPFFPKAFATRDTWLRYKIFFPPLYVIIQEKLIILAIWLIFFPLNITSWQHRYLANSTRCDCWNINCSIPFEYTGSPCDLLMLRNCLF